MFKFWTCVSIMFLPCLLTAAPQAQLLELEKIQTWIEQNEELNTATHDTQNKIQRFLPILKTCIEGENRLITTLLSDQLFINQNNKRSHLDKPEKRIQENIIWHQQQLKHCEYLQDKLSILDIHFQKLRYDNYQQTLFVQQKYIFNALSDIKLNWIEIGDAIKRFLTQATLLKHLEFLAVIVLIFFIYLQFSIFFKSEKKSASFSFKNGAYIIGLLLFTDPVFYHNLATHYGHLSFLWTVFYSRVVIVLMFILIFSFYVTHLQGPNSWREFIALLFGGSNLLWVSGLIFQDDLAYKYLCLLSLPSLSALLIYFMLFRILAIIKIAGIEERRMILWLRSKLIVLTGLFGTLFILGCIGFIDMALTYWLGFLLSFILLLWFFIFKMMIDNLLLQSQNKEHWLGQFIRTHMVILEHEPLPELRILKAFWLFGSAILIFLIIWTSFYMPSYFVIKIYYLFFKNQYLLDKNLIVIHLMQAIGVFLMLNMMNRFLSKYLATHCVSHTEDIAKYQRVFFILGIVVAFVLSLRVSNLYMESIAYLLGGLALGAGVGLQPVIANFCAGIYLLLKHPFTKGDLIAIASVKGVVKKIGIMEILIESFDKVQLNIPNVTVFKTIVYNYSSPKHHPPKIQLLFSFEEIAQLETYKTCLLHILGQEKQVLMKGLHPPELLLFVKDNVYELALVCSIEHFSKIEQVLAHLTVSFIDHLYIHQPSLRLKDARVLDG